MSPRIQLETSDAIAKLRNTPVTLLRSFLLPEIEPRLLRFHHLTVRVQNCLRRLFQEGVINGLDDLQNHTVGELLDARDFGLKSLFDLLEAMKLFGGQLAKGDCQEVINTRQALSVSQVDGIIT